MAVIIYTIISNLNFPLQPKPRFCARHGSSSLTFYHQHTVLFYGNVPITILSICIHSTPTCRFLCHPVCPASSRKCYNDNVLV